MQKHNLKRLLNLAALRLVLVGIASLGLTATLQAQDGARPLRISCGHPPGTITWTVDGPAEAEFIVEGSEDLEEWIPAFADRLGDVPCPFIDPVRSVWTRRFYRAVLTPPALNLGDPGAMGAAPFSLLPVQVSGLDAASGGVYARFFDEHGFTAEVAAIEVSATGATFPVPAWIAQPTQTASRSVNLHVLQRAQGRETISRTIRGFSIEGLPESPHPPGAVAIHYLEGAVHHAQQLLEALPGTPFDTAELGAALTQYSTMTADLIELLRASASSVSLGNVAGQPLKVETQVLRNLDSFVLGFLSAQGASLPAEGLARTQTLLVRGNCARSEAHAYSDALLHNPEFANGPRAAYYGAYGRCTAGAFQTAYQVVAGAGGVGLSMAALAGVPAEALALSSGALLYITTQGAAGLVALSGALGQEDTAAAEMLQTGVDMIEDLLRGPAKSVLNETSGTVLDLITSVHSLKTAFSAVPLDPEPITKIRPETLNLGLVGGCEGGTLTGTIEVITPAGTTWEVEVIGQAEDPAIEVSPKSGTGPGTISFRIIAAPQVPTPGFACDNTAVFQFSPMLTVSFSNGAFATALIEYQYLLVL